MLLSRTSILSRETTQTQNKIGVDVKSTPIFVIFSIIFAFIYKTKQSTDLKKLKHETDNFNRFGSANATIL